MVQGKELAQSKGLTSKDISVTSLVPDPHKRDIIHISHHNLFSDSDDEEEPEDVESSDNSKYCQVIAVKRYKTDTR